MFFQEARRDTGDPQRREVFAYDQYRVHIVLELDRLANQPREHASHLQRIGDREADETGAE